MVEDVLSLGQEDALALTTCGRFGDIEFFFILSAGLE
jgi:hypothetical protein